MGFNVSREKETIESSYKDIELRSVFMQGCNMGLNHQLVFNFDDKQDVSSFFLIKSYLNNLTA